MPPSNKCHAFLIDVVSIWVSVKIGWVEFELNNKFTVDATKTSFITLTLKPISNITSFQQALISLKYCTGEIVLFYYWSFELWSQSIYIYRLVTSVPTFFVCVLRKLLDACHLIGWWLALKLAEHAQLTIFCLKKVGTWKCKLPQCLIPQCLI
jgi:hypothetical protein